MVKPVIGWRGGIAPLSLAAAALLSTPSFMALGATRPLIKASWERRITSPAPTSVDPAVDDIECELELRGARLFWREGEGGARRIAGFSIEDRGRTWEFAAGEMESRYGGGLLLGPHRFPLLPPSPSGPTVRLSRSLGSTSSRQGMGASYSFFDNVLRMSFTLIREDSNRKDDGGVATSETGSSWAMAGSIRPGRSTRWMVGLADLSGEAPIGATRGLRYSLGLDREAGGGRMVFELAGGRNESPVFEGMYNQRIANWKLGCRWRRFPPGGCYRDSWSGDWLRMEGSGLQRVLMEIEGRWGKETRIGFRQDLGRRSGGGARPTLPAAQGETRIHLRQRAGSWSGGVDFRHKTETGERGEEDGTRVRLDLGRRSSRLNLGAALTLAISGGETRSTDEGSGYLTTVTFSWTGGMGRLNFGAHRFSPSKYGPAIYYYEGGANRGRVKQAYQRGTSWWMLWERPEAGGRIRVAVAQERCEGRPMKGRIGIRWILKGS